ncbi:MAG: hypothetical protein R3215_10400 [Halomonas sp.]|nr:hypothetical protein [Halomonas sp.]
MGEYLDMVDWLGFDPCPPHYAEDDYIEALNREIDGIRLIEKEGLRIKPSRLRKAERLERILSMAAGPLSDDWPGDDEGW